jgi:hypothetical protein
MARDQGEGKMVGRKESFDREFGRVIRSLPAHLAGHCCLSRQTINSNGEAFQFLIPRFHELMHARRIGQLRRLVRQSLRRFRRSDSVGLQICRGAMQPIGSRMAKNETHGSGPLRSPFAEWRAGCVPRLGLRQGTGVLHAEFLVMRMPLIPRFQHTHAETAVAIEAILTRHSPVLLVSFANHDAFTHDP